MLTKLLARLVDAAVQCIADHRRDLAARRSPADGLERFVPSLGVRSTEVKRFVFCHDETRSVNRLRLPVPSLALSALDFTKSIEISTNVEKCKCLGGKVDL